MKDIEDLIQLSKVKGVNVQMLLEDAYRRGIKEGAIILAEAHIEALKRVHKEYKRS